MPLLFTQAGGVQGSELLIATNMVTPSEGSIPSLVRHRMIAQATHVDFFLVLVLKESCI